MCSQQEAEATHHLLLIPPTISNHSPPSFYPSFLMIKNYQPDLWVTTNLRWLRTRWCDDSPSISLETPITNQQGKRAKFNINLKPVRLDGNLSPVNRLSFNRTASPNVEGQHFINNKSQIVVKSRGNHGPATVELFDTRTGALKGKVLAYAIQHGQPSWARGMQD